MELKGKVTKVLDLEKGTSKAGKEWQKRSFVIDNGNEYNNLLCIEAFGDERVELVNGLSEGDEVEVAINVSSRLFSSRYSEYIFAISSPEKVCVNLLTFGVVSTGYGDLSIGSSDSQHEVFSGSFFSATIAGCRHML